MKWKPTIFLPPNFDKMQKTFRIGCKPRRAPKFAFLCVCPLIKYPGYNQFPINKNGAQKAGWRNCWVAATFC